MEDWMDNDEEMSMGDIFGLIQEYESALSEDRSLLLDEDSYERIIQFYQDNREFKRAISVADAAIGHYPFSPAFFILKAEVLAEQSSFEYALEMLNVAQILDATEISIYLIRGDIYLWTSEHKLALEQLDIALGYASEQEDFSDIYLLKASVYEDLEQYLEVIDALELAVKAQPGNPESMNRLWFATEIAETFERSEAFHLKQTNLFPYDYLAWFNLGHALYYQKKYDKAIEAFEFAIAIDDKYEPAHLFLGDVFFEIENYQKAQEAYFEAIQSVKPYKESFYKLAECFERLSDYQKARYYLRKATNIDAEYDEAYFKIGETYMAEENFSQAITSFERALKVSGDDTEYLSSLGDAHLLNDDPTSAIPYFQRAIELEPHNMAHYVHLGSAFYELNDCEIAYDTFELACKLFADSAEVRFVYGVYLLQDAQRKRGLEVLEEGLQLNISDAKLIFEMDKTLRDDSDIARLFEVYNVV